jgi:chromosome segregation ATPase
MDSALDEAKGKKDALRSVLREIELKLEGLSVDKETYGKIEAIELKKKAYQKMLLVRKVEQHQDEAA